ncbi:MAG: helix-turn-helix domain-containing protein [Lachnospiraceae bacterium]|nr:helix-turn-helix domain-containing protein [Lachnospiraceae bacterium]
MMSGDFFPVIDLVKTGRRIRQHRIASGLTVRQVQDHFGFEYPQAVYKWEAGKCLPTVDNLLVLRRLFHLEHLEDLLVLQDQEVSPVYGPFYQHASAILLAT